MLKATLAWIEKFVFLKFSRSFERLLLLYATVKWMPMHSVLSRLVRLYWNCAMEKVSLMGCPYNALTKIFPSIIYLTYKLLEILAFPWKYVLWMYIAQSIRQLLILQCVLWHGMYSSMLYLSEKYQRQLFLPTNRIAKPT